jgi:hypothetical protein
MVQLNEFNPGMVRPGPDTRRLRFAIPNRDSLSAGFRFRDADFTDATVALWNSERAGDGESDPDLKFFRPSGGDSQRPAVRERDPERVYDDFTYVDFERVSIWQQHPDGTTGCYPRWRLISPGFRELQHHAEITDILARVDQLNRELRESYSPRPDPAAATTADPATSGGISLWHWNPDWEREFRERAETVRNRWPYLSIDPHRPIEPPF